MGIHNLPTGFQAFSEQELKERLKMINKSDRKLLKIEKDVKPSFADHNWKQTYSFQLKENIRKLLK